MSAGRTVRRTIAGVVVSCLCWLAAAQADGEEPPPEQSEVRAAGGANDTSYTTQFMYEAYGVGDAFNNLSNRLPDFFNAGEDGEDGEDGRRAAGALILETLRKVDRLRRPTNLLILTGRYVWDNDKSTDLRARLARVRYTDVASSFDFGVEQFSANPEVGSATFGIGLFAKAEIYGVRGKNSRNYINFLAAESIQGFKRRTQKERDTLREQALALIRSGVVVLEDIRRVIATVRQEAEMLQNDMSRFIDEAIATEKRPRIALTANYRHFDDVGNGVDFGVVYSRLHFPPHLTPTLSVERAQFNSQGDSRRSGYRVTGVLTYQDTVPSSPTKRRETSPEEEVEEYLDTWRWHWMVGVGHTFKNQVDRRDSSLLFVRHRPASTYGLECSAFIGRSRRSSTVFGVSVERAFDW